MNPFISLREFSYQSQENFFLIYCSPEPSISMNLIPHSHFYYIDENVEGFKQNCQSIELEDDKTIICYDNGDLIYACKAYWGFKATGHDDVKVLLGGLKSCEKHRINLTMFEVKEIKKSDSPFLPFNDDLAMTKKKFYDKEAYTEQVIEAKKIGLEITDNNGEILAQSSLVNVLRDAEIEYRPNKITIVHGKNAFLVALILNYIGERTISVVLEDTSGFVSAKKGRKTVEYKKTEKVEDQTSQRCSGCRIF